MKQFFLIVFGGLAAIGGGLGIAYGAGWLWRHADSSTFGLKASSLVAAAEAIVNPVDGTSISGMKRLIRYTASEEEDIINAAAKSLPNAVDGRITAKSYIVKNLVVGETVIGHETDTVLPIASVTKLVTAIIARKAIASDEHVTITREIMSTYGNTAQFRTGEIFLAQDLYYPLLMVSSNDAAEALAQDYGRRRFIEAMNAFTQSIGAYRTYFADPSGLSDKNVSTANDLALILDWIRRNDPQILDITMLKSKTVKGHTWVNLTHFLNWSNYIGGKNGYTPEADSTSASLFTLGAKKNLYAVVILGSESRDGDGVKLVGKVK